jgi:uncharacterized protein (DUF58 family)
LPELVPARSFRPVPVRWGLSAHARRLLTLAVTGLVLALLTGRPEFAGAAAPALILLVRGRDSRPAAMLLRFGLADPRATEGDPSLLEVDLAGHDDFEADVELEPAEGVTTGPPVTIPAGQLPAGRGSGAAAEADSSQGYHHLGLPFTAQHWGYRPVGRLKIVLRDPGRLTEGTIRLNVPWLDCRPVPASLQGTIMLSKLPSRLGERPSRAAGEGSEFAGVRAFVPGDRQRRVNWPATTRLGTLHLSTFAAERIENVVVIADASADLGPAGATTLDLVLRGAAGTISRYLATRDRVGLIVFGSRLNWIPPGQGYRHANRLMQLLVSSPAGWERAQTLARLPRAALPPGSLVLVFSPLLDPRIVESVRDMRERGFGVLVIDVLTTSPEHDGSRLSGLTGRLWRLEQDAVRFSMKELGVPVVHWDGRTSLDGPLGPFSRRVMVVNR